MKLFLSIAFLSLFSFGIQAQALFKGNMLATAYFGYPNLLRAGMQINEGVPTNADVHYTGIAPSGLRFMYMVSDDFSIGVDLMYTQSSARYTTLDSSFFNNEWNYVTNSYLTKKSRFRPQFRFDLHLGSTGANFDHYIGLAIGGNLRTREIWQNNILVSTQPNALDFVVPVSARVCYGFRYFLNYNLALSGELGLGGPIFQGGLCYRF